MLDLDMSDRKMSDFVLLPFLGFTLVMELRNFDFKSHRNTSILFDQKSDIFKVFWKTKNYYAEDALKTS